jgi:hypothetical protein
MHAGFSTPTPPGDATGQQTSTVGEEGRAGKVRERPEVGEQSGVEATYQKETGASVTRHARGRLRFYTRTGTGVTRRSCSHRPLPFPVFITRKGTSFLLMHLP